MRVNYYDTFYVRLYNKNDELVWSVMDNGFETISDICNQVCCSMKMATKNNLTMTILKYYYGLDI